MKLNKLYILFLKLKNIILQTSKEWDKLSPTENNVEAFVQKNLNSEINTNNPDYYNAHYLAQQGERINKHFRSDTQDNSELNVEKMLYNYNTKIDIVLYRGVDERVFNDMLKYAKNISDCDLYEKGFLSTSLIKGKEIQHHNRLRIFIPAGTNCIYLGKINNEEYYEVVVQRRAKLKIISADKVYLNCILIDTL